MVLGALGSTCACGARSETSTGMRDRARSEAESPAAKFTLSDECNDLEPGAALSETPMTYYADPPDPRGGTLEAGVFDLVKVDNYVAVELDDSDRRDCEDVILSNTALGPHRSLRLTPVEDGFVLWESIVVVDGTGSLGGVWKWTEVRYVDEERSTIDQVVGSPRCTWHGDEPMIETVEVGQVEIDTPFTATTDRLMLFGWYIRTDDGPLRCRVVSTYARRR